MGIRKSFDSEDSYQQYLVLENEARKEAKNENISFFQIIKMLLGFENKNCNVAGEQEE